MSTYDYLALDVETANEDLASICQIGIAAFAAGRLVKTWVNLVNPQQPFSMANMAVHHIEPQHVANAPTWKQIYPHLHPILSGHLVATHTYFDRVSIQRTCGRYQIPAPECTWLDTLRVARRVWPEQPTHSLPVLATQLGITYQRHDALEDARAAGEMLAHAIKTSGIPASDWPAKLISKDGRWHTKKVTQEGNPDGALYGHTIVFTGELSISRLEAAALAARVGCTVANSVTRKTTLLVVGDQDLQVLAGHTKSAKHRRAEELIAAGQSLRILGESDFRTLVDLN